VGVTGLGDSWALRWAWQLVGVKVGVGLWALEWALVGFWALEWAWLDGLWALEWAWTTSGVKVGVANFIFG